jgi:V/A-type H+-transporting ATPase subunit I
MGRPLGWILVLAGGYLHYLGADTIGAVLLAIGLGLVLVYASERRITDLRSAALRGFDGLVALTGVSRMFGDILSYLRLFALGLASSSLALTFNDLAVQVRQALPGEGLLLAILILLVGHAINLALSVLSGFVHGLRLNFIEFFNWGLSDEGYPFRPFASKEWDRINRISQD